MTPQLDGMYVQLIVSDPWDFVTAWGSGPFKAWIVEIDNSSPPRLLLKLERPIEYRDCRFEFLVASPRHTHDSLADLPDGRSIHINALCAESGNITKEDRFYAKWRGGLTLIGDLQKDDRG